MKVNLHKPSDLIHCEINLPGSKSISNRILMIRALSGFDFSIQNLSDSDDTRHLQDALKNYSNTSVINVGHAGTDMRFLTAFLSLQNGSYELTGSERLQQRPIKDLVEALKKLGADITYKTREGYPPLLINGKHLEGGNVEINGGVSSQFITALLMTAPCFKNGLDLFITGSMVSKPYVNMTVTLMKAFGVSVTWDNERFRVVPAPYFYSKKKFIVEADWSAASYYYSLIALSSISTGMTLKGLSANSSQADAVCKDIYHRLGVTTEFIPGGITITKTHLHENIEELNLSLIECPDIAQTIACTCIGLGISFKFTGLQTLKIKETDRIMALQNELKKCGFLADTTEDSIQWANTGRVPVMKNLVIKTYNDHRMAMSFAPLCLLFDELIIEDAEVVSKSYPLFWKHLKQTGINQTKL